MDVRFDRAILPISRASATIERNRLQPQDNEIGIAPGFRRGRFRIWIKDGWLELVIRRGRWCVGKDALTRSTQKRVPFHNGLRRVRRLICCGWGLFPVILLSFDPATRSLLLVEHGRSPRRRRRPVILFLDPPMAERIGKKAS